MSGYSEVFLTLAAMVLFSLILTTTNKTILFNSQKEIGSDVEKRAVTIAQSYISEARVLPFDANSTSGPPLKTPEGFSNCGPGPSDTSRATFNDFDDYHGWTENVDWKPGSGDKAFHVKIKVLYVHKPNFSMENGSMIDKTLFKKMKVTVTSDYLTDNNGNNIEITIPYLRRYYKRP